MSNSTKKHLLVLELYCLRTISLDIVRKKYRELARIFHPDISRKNTSPQMVLINNAKDFIIDNLGEANHVLSLIWQNRNFEFGAVYDEANKPYSSKTPLEELMVKASMFRAIDGFKDATRKAKEVEDLINKIIEEERRGEKLYESTLLDINSATIEELQKAIKVLESIITYRDARQLIVKYKAAITQKLKEIERIKAIYKNAQAQINASMTVAEIEKIIKELNSIATYQDAAKLIIVYYDRLNQIGSVDLKLANERKEIRYRELTPLLKRAKTKDAYQNIVKEFSKLGGYKDSTFIIENAREQIRFINEKELYDKNQRIYTGAKKYLSYDDNKSLQMAIDELRKVINFKDAKDIISEARRRIIENDDLSRKTELYNKNLKLIKSDKSAVLEKARNVYSSLGDFKDSKRIFNELDAKITEIQNKIYQNAVIKNIDKTENIEHIKKSILLLKTITSYKNAEILIKKYQERITDIEKQKAIDERKRIENTYQKGLIKTDDNITVDFLKEKIAILKTIEDYKDSKTLISKYRDHVRHIKTKKAAAHWKRFKFVYIASALVISLVVGFSAHGIKLISNKNYAITLVENGDINAAREFINNNDVPQKEKLEKVILSADYLEEHNYEDAITTFTEINGEVSVDYDTAGGNPTNNQTIFKKSAISNPNKDGYSNGKWLVDSYNFYLKSEYKLEIKLVGEYSNIITYNITYHYNGGSPINNPTAYNVTSETFRLNHPTKTGNTFSGWFKNSDLTGTNITEIAKGSFGNIDLYAKWSINEYTIFFETNGGSIVGSITKPYGTVVDAPEEPTKRGYEFVGWFVSESTKNEYIFDTMPAENITLLARWSVINYSITYENNGGQVTANPTSYNIETATIILYDALRDGYTFEGWFDNFEMAGLRITTIEQGSISDLVLFAKWSINEYTIYFDSLGGSEVASITQDFNTPIVEPAEPVKGGYVFDGWYLDKSFDNEYLFTTMPAQNIILFARWSVITYSIEYIYNGGDYIANPTTYTVETNTIELLSPKKTGHTFEGWYDNVEFAGVIVNNIEKGSIGDRKLYAKWAINSYRITFNENGGEEVMDIVGDYASEIELPTPNRTGYSFMGWYDDFNFNNLVDYNSIPDQDKKLYAKWLYNNKVLQKYDYFELINGTADADGNLIIAGISYVGEEKNFAGVFLIKLDQEGIVLWDKLIGGFTSDYAYGIVTDSENNIYVTGMNSGINHPHLIKLNTEGTIIFKKVYGRDVYHDKYLFTGSFKKMVIDSNDNIIVESYIGRTTNLTTINSNGEVVESTNFGGYNQNVSIISMKVDEYNNLYVLTSEIIFKKTAINPNINSWAV